MLKEFTSVVKVLIKNSFRRNSSNKKKLLILAIVVFLGFLPILIMIGIGAYYVTPKAMEAEIFLELIVMVLTGSQFTIFFFGIFSILAYMFFSDDAEFLAALPVSKTTLFTSKLTMVYINELIVSAAVLIPMLLIMGISAINHGLALGAEYFILATLAVFLMPLIPLMLVSILAFPMMYVVSFFKRRAALSTIVLIVLFVGLMGLYFNLMGGITDTGPSEDAFAIGENYIKAIQRISNIVFFNTLYTKAMLGVGNFIINIGLFILVIGTTMTITILLSSMLYHKSVMGQLESAREIGGRGQINAQKGIAKAFLLKDFKMLLRNPGFAFQSFMGPIITPLIIIFMARSLQVTSTMPDDEMIAFTSIMITGVILFLVSMMLCGTNFVASVAFTREGKYFYFNKYLPIPYKDLIKGKVDFSVITGMVGVVTSTIAYAISVDVNIVNIMMFAVGLTILTYGFVYMGVYRDLRKPKLDWNNVQEAVKQNLNAMFPMLIGSLLGIIILIPAIIIGNAIKTQFLSWLILWIIVFIPGIIVLMYYKAKLDNCYVELLDRIEP